MSIRFSPQDLQMLFDMIDTDKSGTIEAVPVPTVPPPASTRACGDDPRIPRVATENVLMLPNHVTGAVPGGLRVLFFADVV